MVTWTRVEVIKVGKFKIYCGGGDDALTAWRGVVRKREESRTILRNWVLNHWVNDAVDLKILFGNVWNTY